MGTPGADPEPDQRLERGCGDVGPIPSGLVSVQQRVIRASSDDE